MNFVLRWLEHKRQNQRVAYKMTRIDLRDLSKNSPLTAEQIVEKLVAIGYDLDARTLPGLIREYENFPGPVMLGGIVAYQPYIDLQQFFLREELMWRTGEWDSTEHELPFRKEKLLEEFTKLFLDPKQILTNKVGTFRDTPKFTVHMFFSHFPKSIEFRDAVVEIAEEALRIAVENGLSPLKETPHGFVGNDGYEIRADLRSLGEL